MIISNEIIKNKCFILIIVYFSSSYFPNPVYVVFNITDKPILKYIYGQYYLYISKKKKPIILKI